MQSGDHQEAEIPPYQGYQATDDKGTHDHGLGQKLNDDDEQFTDLLVRKMRQELKNDINVEREDKTIGYRVALAIVSVLVLVPIFITLIVALEHGFSNTGAEIAVAWSMIAVCAAILLINVTFNNSKH